MNQSKAKVIRPFSMGRENQLVVLKEIRAKNPISRAQIAVNTGLSKPSVARAVEQLLSEGLIFEKDFRHIYSEPGRKPRGLVFNARAGFFQSVDIGGTEIHFALGDLSGTIIKTLTLKNPCRHWDHLVELVSKGIERLIRKSNIPSEKVKGIAIGAQGVVDIERESVTSAPNIEDLGEYPLKAQLEERILKPIWLENDVNLGAIGELWQKGKNHKNVVYISLGTVIGGAIIIDGHLHRGHNCYAGEIGWFIPDRDHLFKRSGKFGCLENLATGPALVRKTKELLDKDSARRDALASCENITPKEIFAAYGQGSKVADEVITEWIENLGITLCNIASLLNPELIILGGGLTGSCANTLDKLRDIVEYCTQVPPEIEISSLKEKAYLLGGLRLCLDRYFLEYVGG
jgi:glucokinase